MADQNTPAPTGEAGEIMERLRVAILSRSPEHAAIIYGPLSRYYMVTLLGERDALITAQAAEVERMRGAWDWLSSRKTLSLEHYSPVYCDDDDQAEEWRVHQVSGGINDREWEVVGAGPTPLAAVSAARAALSPAPKEPEHD